MPDYVVKADLLGKTFPGAKRGEQNVVFENVNFRLKKGEFVTCIGHSGCGKSTILNILAGLDKPSTGCVFNNGTLAFQKHFEAQVLGESWDCDFLDVDFAQIARAMHWHAERIVNPAEVDGCIAAALAADRPTLLDVVVDPEAKAPIVSLTMNDEA